MVIDTTRRYFEIHTDYKTNNLQDLIFFVKHHKKLKYDIYTVINSFNQFIIPTKQNINFVILDKPIVIITTCYTSTQDKDKVKEKIELIKKNLKSNQLLLFDDVVTKDLYNNMRCKEHKRSDI